MQFVITQILLICTSLLAWITTSMGGCILILYYRKTLKDFTFTIPVLLTLWLICTYNLYEYFVLCKETPNVFTYISGQLFNIIAISSSGYIIGRLVSNRIIKREFKSHRLTMTTFNFQSANKHSASKKKRIFIPAEWQKKQIDTWLSSPEHIKSKLTLKQMSKDIMINRADLSIYIQKEYGSKFSYLINSIRLNRAEKFLSDEQNDNLTLSEILEESGFQATSTFFKVFYERHKMSPTSWKKLLSANNKSNKES